MTDHQQAALEAVKVELDSQEAMHCTRVWEAWRYGTMTEEDFVNVSEDDECVQALVAAAEPHLRKKWAEEIREGVNPPDTGKAHEWRRGFITGVLRTARFLEGAGE